MTEPYAYYLKQLDNNEVAYTSFGGGDDKVTRVTFAEVHAKEIVDQFAATDRAVMEIAKKFSATAEQIPPLSKWLQSRLAAPKD